MTLRDKEQEDCIEDVGNKLTNPPTDVQQLLLLLDKAENLLSKVEQCPPQSMHIALQPSIKALISKNFLKHLDLDVKVAVASCLSEITRITAPDAPYDDDLMKEIFGLIVGSFKNLDEMSSRSFSKRVSILETVSKVRSCVLMLDLECDDLILDMFHHFLSTIRSKHSSTVFSSMETVMTLVIEESENISARLLSCLLDHLKIDEKNIISSAKKLAEKVLVNCALKLKPYMMELFCGICTLSDYSKVVTAVCHGNIGTLIQNEMNSSKSQADDSKFSDRTHCDEPLQDNNVVCPEEAIEDADKAVTDAEKVVADADGSSRSVTSNGTFQIGNGDVMVLKQKTEFFQPIGQLRDTGGSILTESDNLGLGATKKPSSGLNLSSLKGRKRKASGRFVNNYQNKIDDKKEVNAITGRRKGRSKETDLSKADGLPFKEFETAASSKPGKVNKLESTPGLDSVTASISLHSPNEHQGTQSRKGLPPWSKPSRSKSSRSKSSRSKSSRKRKAVGKAAVDGSSSASVHRRTLESSQMTNGDLPIQVASSNNSEVIIESEKNLLQCSAIKSHAGCAEDSKTTSTNAMYDPPNEHHGTHSRKGRLSRTKKYGKRNATGKALVDGPLSDSVHKAVLESSQTTSVDLPMSEPSSKKSEVVISEPERNLARSAEDGKTISTTATCDSETKHQRQRGKSGSKTNIREVDLSGQKHITGTKQKKGGGLEDEEDKEVKLKELVSSRKSKLKESMNDQSLAKNSNETKSRLKRTLDTQETSGTKKRRNNVMLVGSKIRVWWPEDERFYHGVVDYFDSSSKKHRILYDDGDVEVLLLKKEKWEPIEAEIMTDRVQEMDTSEVNASELIKKSKKGRRGKATSVEAKTDPQLKVADETKSDFPLKSPDSGVKTVSNDKVPKRKGRPPGKVLSPESLKNSSNGKEMSAKRHKSNSQVNENVEKLEKEKVGRKIKSDHTKFDDKVGDHTPKSWDKVDNHTPKKRGKSKGSSPIKAKSIVTTNSRKKSGDAHDSGIKYNKKEIPLRTESAEAPRKLVGRPAKGSGRKAQGGMKPRVGRNLTANNTPPNDRAKAGRSEASSTIGKKRKRGRRGR